MRFIVAFVALVGVVETASAQFATPAGFRFSYGAPRAYVTGFATGGPCFAPTFRPYGLYAPAPLIVVVPQPIVVIPVQYNLQGFDDHAVRPEPKPRANPNQWHVLRPMNAPAFPAVPRPALVPLAPVAALEDRKPDPEREAARQVRLAQAAFAVGEYGRAGERLAEAIRAKPAEPLPHFLLVQVRLARGEYAEAVAAIRDGLKLAPDWPATAFTPKPLYAGKPDDFTRQLDELKAAAAAYPDDATVQFLLGYQLWFAGERNDATAIFRQLAPIVKDRAAVEAFLAVAVGRLVNR